MFPSRRALRAPGGIQGIENKRGRAYIVDSNAAERGNALRRVCVIITNPPVQP